jgi:hypothetical protein
MANTFKFGNGEWAVGKETALAYNDENSNFKPLPFTFDRASTATVVNKDGLIETVGTDEPRIDFTDNTNGHLLLEPSRTNSLPYSNDFTNARWTSVSSGTGSAATVTGNYAISPDGSQNASRLQISKGSGTTSSDFSAFQDTFSNISTASSSIWIKSNDSNTYSVALRSSNYIVCSVTPEWQRFELNNEINIVIFQLILRGGYGTSDSADILIYGSQAENGSYATSYIPTSGSTATRSADSANGAGNSNVFNDSEGTFFVNFAADFNIYGSGLTDRGISINDGSNTNSARIFQATSLNNRIAYDLDTSSGTNQVFNTSTTFADITDFNKVAFTYKQNEFKIFLNGVQQGSTDTNGSVFSNGTLKGISFDYGQDGNKPFFGRVKEVKYFNSALSDSELQALTS